MDDRDDLNRILLPDVTDHVGVEVPETVAPIQEFVMEMTDSRRSYQPVKRIVDLASNGFRGIGTVLRDLQENFVKLA